MLLVIFTYYIHSNLKIKRELIFMTNIKRSVLFLGIIAAGLLLYISCNETIEKPPVEPDITYDLEQVEGTQGADMTLNQGSAVGRDSWFEVELSGIDYNGIISNGATEGWCVEWDKDIAQQAATHNGVHIYSTMGKERWKPLNHLLTIKDRLKEEDPDLTYREIQAAIWSVADGSDFDVDMPVSEMPPRLTKDGQPAFDKQKVKAIVNEVKSNATSHKYKTGGKHAVFIHSSDDQQTVTVPSDQGSWIVQESGVEAELDEVHFVDEQTGWTVGAEALLHTSDGGQTWELQESLHSSLSTIHFVDNQRGWAAGGRVVQYTNDGGETWQRQDPQAFENVLEESGEAIGSIHFIDANTGWAVASDISHESSYIFHTSDGGQQWEVQYIFDEELEQGDLARALRDIHFANSQIGWAVGGAQLVTGPGGSPPAESPLLLHTTDGGQTWNTELADTTIGGGLWKVHFTDADNGWMIGRAPAADEQISDLPLSHTTDGGQSWNLYPVGPMNGLYFLDAKTGWVAHTDIQHTRDGGETWEVQENPTDSQLNDIHFVDEHNGWAVGLDGTILHFSAD